MKVTQIKAPKDMYNTILWKHWLRATDIFTTSNDREIQSSSDFVAIDGIHGPVLVEKSSQEYIQAQDVAFGYKVW